MLGIGITFVLAACVFYGIWRVDRHSRAWRGAVRATATVSVALAAIFVAMLVSGNLVGD